MTPAALALLGQVLGIAVASGLNLYATVAALGIASRLGWIPGLPPALRGLESPIIIGTAAALFAAEFVLDKWAPAAWLWDTVHTLIRPLGGGLLVFAALGTQPAPVQAGAALAAGAVALAVHGSKAGLRVTLRAASTSRGCHLISATEDVAALCLAVAALGRPGTALVLAGTLLVGVGLAGRRFWRASLLGLRALNARVRRFFIGHGWRVLESLPARLARLVEPPAPGRPSARAARAAVDGLPGVAPWRNGWLVVTAEGARFLHFARTRPRNVRLPSPTGGTVRRGPWADALELTSPGAEFTIYLLRDGPPSELVLRELLRGSALTAA